MGPLRMLRHVAFYYRDLCLPWCISPDEVRGLFVAAAKKAAWGSVQTPTVVSIKEQELEAKNAKPSSKGGPQRVSSPNQEPRSPPLPRSERPSYNEDRPYPGEYRSYGAARRGGATGGYDQRESRWGGSSGAGPRGGDRSGERYGGDRGERYGDRGDRYGGRDSYHDEEKRSSERFGDRPRYNPDMPSHGGAPRREPRPEVPFPSQPPYICYMAGLSEGTEADVREQLPEFWGEDLAPRVKNVRVPMKDGFLRHAFIEFEDADALREALTYSGREFLGRPVTCLVAEPPTNSRGSDRFGGRRDDRGERSFGSGFARSHEPQGEYKRLQLAPRTLPVSSDSTNSSAAASTTSSASRKNDPFGGATASTRDIYASKPEPTPAATTAPAARKSDARSPTSAAKPHEDSRADVSDWKSKKEFKPSSAFRPAHSTTTSANGSKPTRGDRNQQGGRGSGNRGGNDDGDWRSTGKARKPASPSTNAGASTVPTNTSGSNSGSGGNIFDNLDNE